MKERYFRFCLCCSLAFLFGCSPATSGQAPKQQPANQEANASASTPRPYSKDLNELRARFNRDKGKVRLVTLLSPT